MEDELRSCLLETVLFFEQIQRKFHPLMMKPHGEKLCIRATYLRNALDEAEEVHENSESFTAGILLKAAALVLDAVSKFNASDDIQEGIVNAMQAGRKICRMRELLFEIRNELKDVDDFFRETPMAPLHGKDERREGFVPGDQLVHMASGMDPYARGAPTFFMPWAPETKKLLPVVVALHGGFGHGRDFIWTWIREARSRAFFLLAPTSLGITWSVEDPGIDLLPMTGLLEKLAGEYPLDLRKILLTGLSDGATFALRCAQLPETPFKAFSPISGVLPPGDLTGARSRRIYWLHGAHDWMFPAARARSGREALQKAGADITLKIIADLAHAYPSEENAGILTWFDPAFFPGKSIRNG